MSWIKKNVDQDVSDYLFNIRINLPKRVGVFQRDVRPDVIVDFDLLEQQLAETPEMIVFWDQLLAEQKSVVARIKRQMEIVRGYVTSSILEKARENNTTVRRDDIKDLIGRDPKMIELVKTLIKEELAEHKIKAVVNCLQTKADNLRSLAGFKKQEMKQ